jgi:hypothetical protein
MPPLTTIEQFFERLFERPSARLFRTRLQPIQIQHRIERAMEGERLTTTDRTLVPNRYVVRINPSDLAEFGDMSGPLAAELADGALAFARAHRYTVVDRPRVDLLADPSVERADVRVDARFADAFPGRSVADPASRSRTDGAGPLEPDVDPTDTRVFEVPRPTLPRVVVQVTDPDGATRRVLVEGAGLTVGRATDNDLIARDSRVSRHHGRISGRRGTLVYADLGSTNGTRVNGVSVSEVVLGPGDRLELGDTTLVIEVAGATD